MERKELFDIMKPLVDLYVTYWQTRELELTDDHKLAMQGIAHQLLPGTQLDLQCDTCLTNALAIFQSFYDREYPKYLASTVDKPKRKRKG